MKVSRKTADADHVPRRMLFISTSSLPGEFRWFGRNSEYLLFGWVYRTEQGENRIPRWSQQTLIWNRLISLQSGALKPSVSAHTSDSTCQIMIKGLQELVFKRNNKNNQCQTIWGWLKNTPHVIQLNSVKTYDLGRVACGLECNEKHILCPDRCCTWTGMRSKFTPEKSISEIPPLSGEQELTQRRNLLGISTGLGKHWITPHIVTLLLSDKVEDTGINHEFTT